MEYEWDDAKRQINLNKHGIDFTDVQQLFDGRPVITVQSPYPDERRLLTTGMIEDRFVTVVWTLRITVIRIISARRSRDAEKRAYRTLHKR